jgi:lysophospholipase L1-like esterase
MYFHTIMNILFAGDSLIEYFNWRARFPGHKVINAGMAGESVEGLLSRVPGIKGVCPEADMVFIMTGINNVAMGDTDFIGPYRMVIEKLSSAYPEARIFINSLLPSAVDFIDNGSVRAINVLLKDMAESTGGEYLDIHSLFIDAEGRAVRDHLLDDGVHISVKGYAVWSGELEKIVNNC